MRDAMGLLERPSTHAEDLGVTWNGDRLKEIRQKAGLSQEALAKVLGKTQGAVGHWERGLHVPGSDELYAMADALGVSCDTFREEVGTPIKFKKPKKSGD